MTQGYFLWPESSVFRAIVGAPKLPSVDKVERKLQDMFPSGYPVLCSSGRSAIVLSLIVSNMSRSDFVGVFPYASHCVLDAVSRVATPLTGPTSTTAPLRLVYHQWGFVQEKCLPSNSIEDCVDTLCVPGASLFPGGGRFEIWSLPKILGTTSGGVLWCRDVETAQAIRVLRDKKNSGLFLWALRLWGKSFPLAHLCWEGAEGSINNLSRLQIGEILLALQKWDDIVFDRRKKYEIISGYIVDWLKLTIDRLPAVIPVYSDLSESKSKELGILSSYRMIERVVSNNERFVEKVLPIPIHQDVEISWLVNTTNNVIRH